MNILVALLCLVGATAVVSFVLAAFIRSRFLAITGSFVIVELLFFMLLTYGDVAASSDAPEVINLRGLLAIMIAPVILFASFIFVLVAARWRQRKGRP